LILGIVGGVIGAALIGVGIYFLVKKCKGASDYSEAKSTIYQDQGSSDPSAAALIY
jgi:high-affinity Fe2+/Pb2+ permease